MFLPSLSIRRPVLATVMNLVLILLGLVAYDRLTLREFPNIDEPVVTVRSNYKGASAEIVESQVTKPLEDSLAGLEGIEVMTSSSRAESSQITLRFKLTRDTDAAANDVRDRVSRARNALPDEVDDPVVAKVEADAQPIIYIAFTSDRHSPMEITDYADRYVKDRLQNIAGVASADIIGERRQTMRIWLDPQKLAAAQLTPGDIEAALRSQNVEIPAGRIESTNREFTVLSETDLRTKEQFEGLILKRESTTFVRLRDVGRVTIAPEDERRVVRFNGENAVALGIIKQSTANPLSVSADIRKIIPDIAADLPEGMKLAIANDTAIFIDRSIKAVYHTIFEAIVLVLAVILFFLRSARSTFIPVITIPISLIGVFFMMYLLGYTINTLTLLAFVLAIGLVVDDAIVVLENIYRHIEEGMQPREAALKGGTEIGFAVVAMTLTLAAVYAPIGFTEGKAGRLFIEFALTLAGAVIISGFVALTLTPMLCSRLLRADTNHGILYRSIEKILNGILRGYKSLLAVALNWRFVIIIFGLLVAGANMALLKIIRSELSPTEDRGTIAVIASAPEGSTIGYTAGWMRELEPVFSSIPEIDRYFVVAGSPTVSQGISFVRLKPWEERERKQQDITKELSPKLATAAPGIMAFANNPSALGGGGARSKPLQLVLLTNGTYEDLNTSIELLMKDLATYPGLINLDTNLKMNTPQISISLDRDKTASVDADIDSVGRTLETLLGGRKVTRFKQGGEQYDVIVQIEEEQRTNPQDLLDIYVRNNRQEMIKLANLLDVKETVAPRDLPHFNQLRSAEISAGIAPGYTLGDAIKHVDARAKAILPQGMITDYSGEARELREARSSIMITFVLALAFIYLVMAAQFESFISPFIIMLSVPLCLAGGLLALYLTGGTLNIYSQIGLITLVGLITKHGILIVEFANQLQEEGLSKMEAVAKSAALRLRPILMTTGAMVLGALPLALATGAGAESRQQIGWVIIGGMTLGTVFTLFVVPVVYSLIAATRTKAD